MEDLVSVIMGIYNIPTKDILSKSINSILNQSYKNIEFIIIDDCSTNNTYDWANEITKNDNRVILMKNERNLGLAKTLNICLKVARGKYIARMDGDDFCDLSRIEKQVRFLKSNPNYKLVNSSMILFDENGEWGKRNVQQNITVKSFLFTNPIHHPTIFTYKECYDQVNGYCEKWYATRNEDYDLFMRMYANKVTIYGIQECLYYYREDENCYSKRKYIYRICEAIVKIKGFYKLKLYPIGLIYIFKPLIVGLIPQQLLRKIRGQSHE